MAVTVIPRRTGGAQTVLQGLQLASNIQQGSERLEEQRLSGISNRAQQAALTEQAEATAESTRIKNKVLNSLPKDVLQGIYTKESEANKAQIFNLNSMLKNQAQLQALETAKLTQSADVAIKTSQAELLSVKQSSAKTLDAFNQQLKKSESQSAAFKAQDAARISRVAERTSALASVSGDAGKSAIYQAYDQGKTEAEMVEIGVAADAAAAETTAKTESRFQAAAAQLSKSKDAGKFQKDVKESSDKFGLDTQKRRVSTAKNVGQPLLPTVDFSFDKFPTGGAPGVFKVHDKGTFGIDYFEAKEMGKDTEKEWLQKYEKQHGEPYDIPEEPTDDTAQPPADQVKKVRERYPNATFYIDDKGTWKVRTNE